MTEKPVIATVTQDMLVLCANIVLLGSKTQLAEAISPFVFPTPAKKALVVVLPT
jgi:hypothetical protein